MTGERLGNVDQLSIEEY